MDIDTVISRICADIKEDIKTSENRQKSLNFSQDQNKKLPILVNQTCKDDISGFEDFKKLTLFDLVKRKDLKTNDELKLEIYSRFKTDIENRLNEFLKTSKDVNADKGMFKCSLETWQCFINEIGLFYFRKNKYLKDINRISQNGGDYYNDDLLYIALDLYENLTVEYRKQFFIYDCCRFCGIDKDNMYRLNEIHSQYIKKAHTVQESSYRTALASGRSNVTAMAILLNHDYDYTRTTQVIHTNGKDTKTADNLPVLDTVQQIEVDTSAEIGM